MNKRCKYCYSPLTSDDAWCDFHAECQSITRDEAKDTQTGFHIIVDDDDDASNYEDINPGDEETHKGDKQ